MPERDKQIEELKAQITKMERKPNFFNKLSNVGKIFATITGIIVALPILTGTLLGIFNYVFQDKIEEYEHVLSSVNKLDAVEAKIDSMAMQFNQGGEYFAVGYRASRDGEEVHKYYRDWDGTIHKIYPDQFYSDSVKTYYYYITKDGTKHWCYSK